MRKTTFPLTLFFILSASVVVAQNELDRTWFLTSLEINGQDIPIPADTFPTLSIDSEGGIYEGIAGCNSYEGAIDVASVIELSILDLSYTLAMCDSAEQENFEGQYFQFLGNSEPEDFNYDVTYTVEDELGVLILAKANGDIARYSADNPNPPFSLTQEIWYLDYFENDGIAQNYPPYNPLQLDNHIKTSFEDYNNDILESYQELTCIYGGLTIYTEYKYFDLSLIEFSGTGTLAMDCDAEAAFNYDYNFINQIDFKKHTYEIIEEGQGRRLILTDENGDRTFYENAFLSTQEFTQPLSITLYPNPVASQLRFSGIEISTLDNYTIYNLEGKNIQQAKFASFINVSQLSKGLYFITLQSQNQSTTLRFVKK